MAAVHLGKRPHGDLEPARVIRLVGEPAAVGRDDAVPLGERGLHERRDATRPVQRHLHHVLARLRGDLGEDQPAAVGRHGRGVLLVGTLGQPLDRAGAVRRLPEEISCARALRTEDQPAAVGRPHRVGISRIERGAGERRAAQIPDPDVQLLIGCRTPRRACHRVTAADRHTRAAAPGSASRGPGGPPTRACAAHAAAPPPPDT